MGKHSEISIEDKEQQEREERVHEERIFEQEEYEQFKKEQDDQWFDDRYNSYNKKQEDYIDEIPGAPTALTLFEKGLNKSEIKIMANAAVDSVLENGNPLQTAEGLKAMEMFIEEVREDKKFKDYVREEAAKSPKGFISKSGAKIEVCETGHVYDFSKCGDPQLVSLESLLKECSDALKVRKDFLKTVPVGGLLITDELTGETNKIFCPTKTSVSSYKITLAR